MLRRTRKTLWIVATILLLLAAAIYLRSKAPPEAARLLPESDGILYINLKPIRALLHAKLQPVPHEASYQQFLDATGINPERDLDEAAIGLHRMKDAGGPNGPVAYSMVLVGKLNGKALAGYLTSLANSREDYAGHTVFSIPSQGRTVRVAQIGYDMVAITNYPTEEKMHSILDRYRTAALPFAGSTLLAEHYKEIPLLSLAWGMGQIGLPFSESGSIHLFGLSLPLLDDTTLIASLRWTGALRFRVEELTGSESDAASQAAGLSALVTLARGATEMLPANAANSSLKALLHTAAISRRNSRVVATAQIPTSILAEFLSSQDATAAASPAARPTSPAR